MAGANSNTFQHVLNVPTLAALAGVHVSELDEGAICWVTSQQEPFFLTTNSSLTANGIDVIQPLAGSARAGKASALWIAQSTIQAAAAIIPAYVIDPVNGSDANTGATGAPLKTLTEWANRVSPYEINTAMTVTILSDLNAGDEPMASFKVGSAGSLVIQGAAPTALTSGTFTAVTQCNPATNTPYAVTDTAQGNANFWATYINQTGVTGQRIRVTSGANVGNVLWPAKNLGAKAARVSAPMVPTPAISFLHALGAIAVTDPYVVEQLVKIQRCDFEFLIDRGAPFTVPPKVQIIDLAILLPSLIAIVSAPGYDYPNFGIYGCDAGPLNVSGQVMYVDCRALQMTLSGAFSMALAGLFVSGGNHMLVTREANGPLIDIRFMVQGDGSNFGLQLDGAGNSFGQIQVYDCLHGLDIELGSGVTLDSGYTFTTEIFGQGNTGQGCVVRLGTLAARGSVGTFAVTGAGGNVRINNVVKTWAQTPFIGSDIAAGSGTTFSGMVIGG